MINIFKSNDLTITPLALETVRVFTICLNYITYTRIKSYNCKYNKRYFKPKISLVLI